MTHYTLAFPFTFHSLSYEDCSYALIQKGRPSFLAGKLNGIGGKIELDDNTPREAAARELYEESGIEVSVNELLNVATLTGIDPNGETYVIHVFAASIEHERLLSAITRTDEMIILANDEALEMMKLSFDPDARYMFDIARVAALHHARCQAEGQEAVGLPIVYADIRRRSA